jgi:predicted NAD/FAD-dependent oxidoreductase
MMQPCLGAASMRPCVAPSQRRDAVQITRALAAGLDIRLQHVVSSIEYGGGRVTVSCANGGVFSGHACVVTIPIGCLQVGLHVGSTPGDATPHVDTECACVRACVRACVHKCLCAHAVPA